MWKTIDGVEFSKLSHRGDFVVVEIRSAPYFEALLVARIGYTIQWHPYYVRSGMFNGEVCRPIFFDDHKKQAAFDPTPTVAPEMYSRAIESIEAKILSLSTNCRRQKTNTNNGKEKQSAAQAPGLRREKP